MIRRKLLWDRDRPALLTLFVWIRTIPFVIALVGLFFNWGVALVTAAVLMVVILALCRLRCFIAAPGGKLNNR